jgi:hypothetical protein
MQEFLAFLAHRLHRFSQIIIGYNISAYPADLSEVGGYSSILSILFPIINTILAKICSLVYAECTLSVYSVYTQRMLLLFSNKLATSNLQRI